MLKTLAAHTNVATLDNVNAMEVHADFAELTGASGYARVALTSEAATEDDGNNRANVDSDNVSFGNLGTGGTIVGAFVYVYNASDSLADLVGIWDLTSTPTNGGPVTVNVADLYRVL
jgi:hypothetical protein